MAADRTGRPAQTAMDIPGAMENGPAIGPVPESLGRTKILRSEPRSIVGPATGFVREYDAVINPYGGCSLGCAYCYAANFTHDEREKQQWGLWVRVKTNALKNMARVPAGSLNGKTIYMATATDPYQPVERQAKITRGILEILAERHPEAGIVIQTRSPLAVRDTDVMREIARRGRVQVNMTVTTDDDPVRMSYEPGCPSIPARLKAVREIAGRGVQTCITMTPLLPLGNPESFAAALLETGTRRFIIQPFHLEDRGNERFVARTDQSAIACTARHFGCPESEAMGRYMEDYRRNEAALRKLLPGPGTGREGFRPPF